MPKQNFKSHEKRKRELAKLGKRQAKDEKRASKRAEGSEPVAGIPVVGAAPVAVAAIAAPKPPTLAEHIERWKNMRVAKPKRR
jgi:hypothetical protein